MSFWPNSKGAVIFTIFQPFYFFFCGRNPVLIASFIFSSFNSNSCNQEYLVRAKDFPRALGSSSNSYDLCMLCGVYAYEEGHFQGTFSHIQSPYHQRWIHIYRTGRLLYISLDTSSPFLPPSSSHLSLSVCEASWIHFLWVASSFLLLLPP